MSAAGAVGDSAYKGARRIAALSQKEILLRGHARSLTAPPAAYAG